jgi:hypothetical protein
MSKRRNRKGKKKASRNATQSKPSNLNPAVNSAVRMIGNAIGNAIAPGFGGPFGSNIANEGHKLFKRVTGMGDYQIRNNTLKGQVPHFGSSKRSIRIQNREYVSDITSGASGAFSIIKKLLIYPTNPDLFPWLSGVAPNYAEYRIHGMLFQYVTTSVDALNSTNTALGKVIMSTQYDPLSVEFHSASEMQNHEFSTVIKPSEETMHMIECDPKQTVLEHLYVRQPDQSLSVGDSRMYDFAKFYLAISGMQASNVTVGELWVTYDIEFFKPRLPALSSPAYKLQWYQATGLDGQFNIIAGVPTELSNIPGHALSYDSGTQTITFPQSFYGYIRYDLTAMSPTNAMAGISQTNPTFSSTITAVPNIMAPSAFVGAPGNVSANNTYYEGGYYLVAGGGSLILNTTAPVTNDLHTLLSITLVHNPSI